MSNVTDWFSVGKENPLPDRLCLYEVKFTVPSNPVMKIYWDGKRWGRCGRFIPRQAWGDKWRGLTEDAA